MFKKHIWDRIILFLFFIILFSCDTAEDTHDLVPVTFFQIEVLSFTSVRLNWGYDYDCEGFRLDRKKGSENWQEEYLFLDNDVYNYTDNNLMQNETICYRIYAIENADISTPVEVEATLSAIANPIFSIPAGSYNSAVEVIITCSEPESSIYYTTDGSEPNQYSALYNSPLNLRMSTTLKAVAYKTGWVQSEIFEATYSLYYLTEFGFYDTPGSANGLFIEDDIVYIADGSSGLRIIDVSDINNPVELGFCDTPGTANDLDKVNEMGSSYNDKYVFVADGNSGLRRIDISDPNQPFEDDYLDTPGNAKSICVDGFTGIVADGASGIRDIWTPNSTGMYETNSYNTTGDANAAYISDAYVFVADGESGLRVLHGIGYTSFDEVNFCDTPGIAKDICYYSYNYYIADGSEGLRIFSYNINVLGYCNTPGDAQGVAVRGNYAYIADGDSGLRVINVSISSAPFEVDFYDTPGNAKAVVVRGDYAYVADGDAGLRIIYCGLP